MATLFKRWIFEFAAHQNPRCGYPSAVPEKIDLTSPQEHWGAL